MSFAIRILSLSVYRQIEISRLPQLFLPRFYVVERSFLFNETLYLFQFHLDFLSKTVFPSNVLFELPVYQFLWVNQYFLRIYYLTVKEGKVGSTLIVAKTGTLPLNQAQHVVLFPLIDKNLFSLKSSSCRPIFFSLSVLYPRDSLHTST